MNRIKYYRFIKTLFGWRSFTRNSDKGNTYLLIKGTDIDKFIESLLEDGYVEEWPLT